MSLTIVILAAGQGTRMRSDIPKVLHPLAGKSLLEHVFDATSAITNARRFIVHGYEGERLKSVLNHLDADWIEQAEQLGTGHAVQQALPQIPDEDTVLILYGDVPLITTATLQSLIGACERSGFGLLTAMLNDPRGYGRIIRDNQNRVVRIVEEKDASQEERQINEVNTGFMAVKADALKQWIDKLENKNAQGEYYLTDVIAMAVADDFEIISIQPDSDIEILGINDRVQLSQMERYYQLIQASSLMRQGVTIADPARFDLRGELEAGQDINIDVNVVLEGRLKIGNNVIIGPNCMLRDSVIGDNVEILANTIIEDAVIGNGCRIGPFSRIRPKTVLDDQVHIGNFVELKKSHIGKGSKVNHLSYVGDSDIGSNVNIGAGTITCNYDGESKHKTIIGDNVFIGSNTQLVAPVTIKKGATVAAGSTITKDVDEDSLAITRTEQKSVRNWKRPGKVRH